MGLFQIRILLFIFLICAWGLDAYQHCSDMTQPLAHQDACCSSSDDPDSIRGTVALARCDGTAVMPIASCCQSDWLRHQEAAVFFHLSADPLHVQMSMQC